MTERKAYVSMPRHNGERFAKLMVEQFKQMNATLDNVGKSRWAELFGTPEKAAQLIADNCEYLDYCGQCWIRAANCDGEYLTVLEWLRGDAK